MTNGYDGILFQRSAPNEKTLEAVILEVVEGVKYSGWPSVRHSPPPCPPPEGEGLKLQFQAQMAN